MSAINSSSPAPSWPALNATDDGLVRSNAASAWVMAVSGFFALITLSVVSALLIFCCKKNSVFTESAASELDSDEETTEDKAATPSTPVSGEYELVVYCETAMNSMKQLKRKKWRRTRRDRVSPRDQVLLLNEERCAMSRTLHHEDASVCVDDQQQLTKVDSKDDT